MFELHGPVHPAVHPGPGGRGVADQHHRALSVDQRSEGAVAGQACNKQVSLLVRGIFGTFNIFDKYFSISR